LTREKGSMYVSPVRHVLLMGHVRSTSAKNMYLQHLNCPYYDLSPPTRISTRPSGLFLIDALWDKPFLVMFDFYRTMDG
jgi:hypothetical protein